MERTATLSTCHVGTQLFLHVNVPRFNGTRRSAAVNMAKASLAPVFSKQPAPRAASRNALGSFRYLITKQEMAVMQRINLQTAVLWFILRLLENLRGSRLCALFFFTYAAITIFLQIFLN
jgi:hypothetical protein